MSPICLPKKENLDDMSGTKVIALGWGGDEKGKFSSVLREVNLKVFTIQSCISTPHFSIVYKEF